MTDDFDQRVEEAARKAVTYAPREMDSAGLFIQGANFAHSLLKREREELQSFADKCTEEMKVITECLKRNDALRKQCEEMVLALEHAKDFCVCERFKTEGFDYGETHPRQGKSEAGKRWLTPKDKIMNVLSAWQKFKDGGA